MQAHAPSPMGQPLGQSRPAPLEIVQQMGQGSPGEAASALRGVSDIHIKLNDLSQSLQFPGPVQLNPMLLPYAHKLAERCKSSSKKLDFSIAEDGHTWRARRDQFVVDGEWIRLRLIPSKPPTLMDLPSPLPPKIVQALLYPELTRGGLILVTGGPGCGKTTTASAIVVSRLRQFGGQAYTVEDPIEQNINGWQGKGYCSQTMVGDDNNWAEAMRGALRAQPAGTPTILFVGEIRDADAAKVALQAAGNGFLVIATAFASDIPSGVNHMMTLLRTGEASAAAAQSTSANLASLLRIVLFQTIDKGMFSAKLLLSPNASSSVANTVRSGNIVNLQNDINYQASILRNGGDLWQALPNVRS